MRPTVLLYDIDGTLVTTGPSARRAIERAFEAQTGHSDAFAFPFDGMTDRAIVRQAFKAVGETVDDASLDAFLKVYVRILEKEIAQAPLYPLHQGIERAVAESLARPNTAVGLGTGNIREGARVKLEKVGIFDTFRFGGFGCDHEDRPELIRIGAERGAAQLGLPLSECRVVVIGDTPKDVAAAQAIGAESIGVGTGLFSADALLACGATRAFHHLGEDGALQALLGD